MRTREAIEAQKKTDFQHPRKEKEKNMKAKSPSNGPHLTPVSIEAQKSNFHQRKSSSLQQELIDDFFGCFGLFGRLEKEKKEKKNKCKLEKQEEKK